MAQDFSGMRRQIIVLFANQYRVVDEKTGEVKTGVSCNYYFNTDLAAEDNVNGSKGTRPAKASLDFKLMAKILKAPAVYDAEFTFNIGSDGKPVLTIVDLNFLYEVEIVPVGSKSAAGAKSEQKAG